MSAQAEPHGHVTKAIHWISGGLIVYGYTKGLGSVSQLADPAVFRFEIAFALLLGLVFAIRWFWTKRIAGPTRLLPTAPRWEQLSSRAVHFGLYAAVFGIILSGLGIALGYAVPSMSGAFLWAMVGLHELTLAILPLLLIVHVAGALWHKFVRRDGVMESMTGRFAG